MLIYVFWLGRKCRWRKSSIASGSTDTDSGGILGCLISKKSRLWKVKAATEMIENQTQSNIGHRIQGKGYSWMQLDRTVLCTAARVVPVVVGYLSSKQEINQPLPTHEDFQILWPDWMPDSSPDTCTGVPLDSWAGGHRTKECPCNLTLQSAAWGLIRMVDLPELRLVKPTTGCVCEGFSRED